MNFVPTIMSKFDNKEYAFDIYSRLLKDRIIFLVGEINDNNASIIISELLYLDNLSNDDIYIYINSPGGSITAGMGIYDTMQFVSSNVITIGIGICASMGAFLLACGDKRYILSNTEVMIHQPLGGAEGQATDIKIAAERIIKLKQKLNNILAKRTGKTIKRITIDTERDNFLDAKEALKYGLVDAIIKKNDLSAS